MMAEAAEIQRVAADVIASELGEDARIVSVTVTEDTDPDAGEILLLRIVYDSNKNKLNAKTVAGMIRHLRSRLSEEIAEERFPLLSFVSRLEAHTEAA